MRDAVDADAGERGIRIDARLRFRSAHVCRQFGDAGNGVAKLRQGGKLAEGNARCAKLRADVAGGRDASAHDDDSAVAIAENEGIEPHTRRVAGQASRRGQAPLIGVDA